MKIKIIFIYLISFLLLSCSIDNDCFVADSIEKVKKISIDDKDHFLYLRISGFNEKEHFYELYNLVPKFNYCGKSTTTLISDIHIDTTEGYMDKLIIKNYKLEVIYSKGDFKIVDFNNVNVEVK